MSSQPVKEKAVSKVSVIENIYVGLAEGNLTPLYDALAPDAEWIEAENFPFLPEGQIVGKEAVDKVIFGTLAQYWDQLGVQPVRVISLGSTVLSQGRYVGTAKSGGKLDSIFAHVWDFEGDTIVRVQQYCDTWQFHRALGVD